MLEAEGLHRHVQLPLAALRGEQLKEPALQLAQGEGGAVDNEVRPLADRGKQVDLLAHRVLDGAAALCQRVRASRLLVAPHDGGHVRVHVEDAAVAVHLLKLVEGFQQLVKAVLGPHIGDQSHLLIAAAGGDAEFGKLRHQGDRHVVHAVIIQILQHVGRTALSRAGEPGDNQEIHNRSLFASCRGRPPDAPCRSSDSGPPRVYAPRALGPYGLIPLPLPRPRPGAAAPGGRGPPACSPGAGGSSPAPAPPGCARRPCGGCAS